MNKTKLSVFIDALFYRFIFFMLFLTLLNYFTKRPYSVILALTLSLAVSVFTTKSLFTRYKRIKRAEKENARYLKVITALSLMKDSELLSYFSKLLSSTGKRTERKKSGLYCDEEKNFYFFKFSFLSLNKADIVKYFNRLEKDQKAVIVAEKYDKDTENFAKRFGDRITLVSGREIFKTIEERAIYPPENRYLDENGKNGKFSLKNLTDKKRVPKLLAYGTLFLLLSYIVPYRIFYIVTGVIFMLFALAVLIFSGKNSPENETPVCTD